MRSELKRVKMLLDLSHLEDKILASAVRLLNQRCTGLSYGIRTDLGHGVPLHLAFRVGIGHYGCLFA